MKGDEVLDWCGWEGGRGEGAAKLAVPSRQAPYAGTEQAAHRARSASLTFSSNSANRRKSSSWGEMEGVETRGIGQEGREAGLDGGPHACIPSAGAQPHPPAPHVVGLLAQLLDRALVAGARGAHVAPLAHLELGEPHPGLDGGQALDVAAGGRIGGGEGEEEGRAGWVSMRRRAGSAASRPGLAMQSLHRSSQLPPSSRPRAPLVDGARALRLVVPQLHLDVRHPAVVVRLPLHPALKDLARTRHCERGKVAACSVRWLAAAAYCASTQAPARIPRPSRQAGRQLGNCQ